jgi:hypothetical protein
MIVVNSHKSNLLTIKKEIIKVKLISGSILRMFVVLLLLHGYFQNIFY